MRKSLYFKARLNRNPFLPEVHCTANHSTWDAWQDQVALSPADAALAPHRWP